MPSHRPRSGEGGAARRSEKGEALGGRPSRIPAGERHPWGSLTAEEAIARRAAEASAAEDREWLERSRYADESAFALLVQKYQERAIAIARHFVQHDEAARDVAQEAFLRVYRNLHRYDPQHRFYTWFYRIVVHLAIDGTRRRGRVRELLRERAQDPPPAVEEPSAELEREDLRGQVGRVLAELPEKYRLLLLLRDLEGFTSKEIAEISGSNHATVRWRLHRARRMFRDEWTAAGYEPFARAGDDHGGVGSDRE